MKTLWLDTIDSTNSEALRRLPDLPSCTVLAAREQTAGRGQRGNTWFSEPGKNLTFSIVLKFGPGAVSARDAHYLNCLASLSVVSLLDSFGIRSQIKWPNDIYVGNKKICGVLIENKLEGQRIKDCVIGIGLDVNQTVFKSDAPNPVSIKLLTGHDTDREQLLNTFLTELQQAFVNKTIQRDYHNRLYRRQGRHPYMAGDKRFEASIVGVNDDGRLMLENEQGIAHLFAFKEVSFIIDNG